MAPLRFPLQNLGPAEQQAYANGQEQERKDIIACIRSTTWSGTEEIVDMIRRRSK